MYCTQAISEVFFFSFVHFFDFLFPYKYWCNDWHFSQHVDRMCYFLPNSFNEFCQHSVSIPNPIEPPPLFRSAPAIHAVFISVIIQQQVKWYQYQVFNDFLLTTKFKLHFILQNYNILHVSLYRAKCVINSPPPPTTTTTTHIHNLSNTLHLSYNYWLSELRHLPLTSTLIWISQPSRRNDVILLHNNN